MRRAIVVQGDHRFMSALVGKETAEVLREGHKIKVTRDLNLDHYGVVLAGETATIVFTHRDTGHIEIEFDRVLPNLHDWRNCLILAPFDSDDLISGLELVSVLEAKELCQAA